jgi:glycine oxidase
MIVVVGAGIAGLSLAYELSKAGAHVTVLEANTIGSGASGVATSYLEPRLGNTPIRAVEWGGLRHWPDLSEELQSMTGLDIGLKVDGQLRVSLPENEEKFLKDLEARETQGWTVQRLTTEDARKIEPSVSSVISAAAFLPDVAWVNGAAVCSALANILRKRGVGIFENCAAKEIASNYLITDAGTSIAFEKLVVCNGMGANPFAECVADMPISRPVRGVNLIFDNSKLGVPVRHLIKHHRGNICPRDTGSERQLIVGTTYEPGETSLDPDEAVIEKLYANVEPILPAIRDMKLLRTTAGLRTKVGDGNLRLGRSQENPNVYFSLSHAGAGFLRAPIVAPEFAKFILEGEKGALTGFLTTS